MNKKSIIIALILASLMAGTVVSASWWQDLFIPKNENLGATVLKVPAGGTGASTFNAGECLIGNGTGAITTGACGSGSGTVTSIGQVAPTGLSVTTTGGTTNATSTWAWASSYLPYTTYASSTLENSKTFYDTPSSRITAGDYLSWSSNTLNLDSILGSAGSPLTAGYFTNLYASSTETGTLYITGSVKPGQLNLSTSTPPDLRYEYDTDTGLGWVSDNSQALYTGGTARLTIDGSGLVTTANSTSTLLTVNTQWVDNEICFSNGQCMSAPSITGSEITFFHHNSASEFAGYERLYTYPPAGTEIDESCSADADIAGGYCSIDSYISTTTDIMIASFPAGTWDFRKFTYVSNTGGNSKLESTVFKRDTVGTETFLFQATSTDINILATGLVDYTSAQSSISFNSNGTDRLVIKLKGWTDSTAARVIHHVYGSSNHYSRTITPLMIENTGVTNAFHDETIYGNWTHSGLLTFGNATGTSLTVNGSTYLATTGGNVGIGTTSPYAALSVDGRGVFNQDVRADFFTATSTTASSSVQKLTATSFFTSLWTYITGVLTAAGGLVVNTFLQIPNSADPTVDAAGEIAINTTTASSSPRYYDGTAERALYPEKEPCLTIASSTLIADFSGLAATSSIPLGFASRHGETWIEMTCAAPITTGIDFGDGASFMNYFNCGSATSTNVFSSNNTFTMRESRWVRIRPSATTFSWITFCPVIRPNAD